MGLAEKRAAREEKIAAHKAKVKAINEEAEEALYDAEDQFGIGCAKIVRGDSDVSMCDVVCVVALSDLAKVAVRKMRDKMMSAQAGAAAKRIAQDEVAIAAVFWPTKARPSKTPGAAATYEDLVERAPALPVAACVATNAIAGLIDTEEVGK